MLLLEPSHVGDAILHCKIVSTAEVKRLCEPVLNRSGHCVAHNGGYQDSQLITMASVEVRAKGDQLVEGFGLQSRKLPAFLASQGRDRTSLAGGYRRDECSGSHCDI